MLKPDILKQMRESGCISLAYGIESGSSTVLKYMRKDFSPDQASNAIRWTREAEISLRTYFMIGMPCETPETIRDTINFSKSLDLTKAFFNIATPYPGSALYDMALQGDGLHLLTRDWKDFKRWGNAVIELKDVSRQELIRWQRRAMIEFYLRPKIIGHHLKHFIKEGHDTFYYKPQPLKYLRSIFSRQK